MTIRKVLGVFVLSSPFIAITAAAWVAEGWLVALAVWGAVAAVVGVAWLGGWLLWGRS